MRCRKVCFALVSEFDWFSFFVHLPTTWSLMEMCQCSPHLNSESEDYASDPDDTASKLEGT
jgi:hypothetical protein